MSIPTDNMDSSKDVDKAQAPETLESAGCTGSCPRPGEHGGEECRNCSCTLSIGGVRK